MRLVSLYIASVACRFFLLTVIRWLANTGPSIKLLDGLISGRESMGRENAPDVSLSCRLEEIPLIPPIGKRLANFGATALGRVLHKQGNKAGKLLRAKPNTSMRPMWAGDAKLGRNF